MPYLLLKTWGKLTERVCVCVYIYHYNTLYIIVMIYVHIIVMIYVYICKKARAGSVGVIGIIIWENLG